MNEALTITGAIFAVLTALIFNRRDVSDLKTEMKESNSALRADLKDSIAALRGDMKEGFAQVNGRIDRMQSDINKMQADINVFAVVSALHDQRITTLEASAKS